jgi:murein L,D-transpeptidase YcbB/YkuD
MLLLVLLPQFAFTSKKSVHETISERTGELIERMAGEIPSVKHSMGGEPLYVTQMLVRFYRNRNYLPAWAGDDNSFPHVADFIDAIYDVVYEGLVAEYYHIKPILSLYGQVQSLRILNPEVMAELDILLTDAFLMLGCHFSAGCVDPVTLEAEWFTDRSDLNIDALLDDALRENRIRETLDELLPVQTGYSHLRRNLIKYKGMVHGEQWPVVRTHSLLKRGDRNHLVGILRKRLILSGDMNSDMTEKVNYFDKELEEAVIYFQHRHGIKADGIVGDHTLEALNVSPEKRLRQIEINLERMRWISRNLGHRYIVVNIADYRLDVFEYGEKIMSKEVVVGKPFWDTPIFSDEIKYIILNPSWKIPDSIGQKEIVPAIKNNPDYLTERRTKIYSSWASDAREIDPREINWSDVIADKFKYKFIQSPGPLNPLGRIKFMFPNKFHIYLHDTPAKGLFSETARAFSHGCIRVSDPVDLAEYLLLDDPKWGRDKILSAIEKGQEERIDLIYPVNIHILYLTAWVDGEGILNFRNDIYSRDKKLDRALKKKPEINMMFLRDAH